jgi:hypothetical protein
MFLLLILFSVVSVPSSALAQHGGHPRVVAEEPVRFEGLPAISSDGSTVAYVEFFDTNADGDDRLVVCFLRLANGRVDRRLVHEVRQFRTLPAPADGRGTTPWRRARSVARELQRGGYRSLAALERSEDGWGFAGHDLTVGGHDTELTVTDSATGRTLTTRRIPVQSLGTECVEGTCHPELIGAWLDVTRRVLPVQWAVLDSVHRGSHLAVRVPR